jgi:peptidoglycan/LPS O-acetylase OafA/YrhL
MKIEDIREAEYAEINRKISNNGSVDFKKLEHYRIDALTSLRFVTALWVFIFHIHIRWPLSTGYIADAIWSVGAFGMAFFFILSGFILSARYRNEIEIKRFSYRHYVLSRFARIYPNYLLILTLTFPLIDWTVAPMRGSLDGGFFQFALFLGSAAALIGAALLSIQGFFYSHFQFWVNGGAWSLSVEWFCYILFPLVVQFCAPLSKSQLWLFFFALACASAALGLIGFLTNNAMPSLYAHPAIRLPEFVMGVIAFRLARDHGVSIHPLAPCLALAGYSILAGLVGPGNYILHNWAVAPLIGLIIMSAATDPRFERLLSHRVLVYLGETSYAFYMFQLFVLVMAERLAPKDANGLIVLGLGLIVTQLGASLMHACLERPARQWIADTKKGPFKALFARA